MFPLLGCLYQLYRNAHVGALPSCRPYLHAAWLAVDLGYEAPVGSVALAVGSQMDPGAAVRFYVLPSLDAPLSEEAACSSASVALQPGAWAVAACNITGRWVPGVLLQHPELLLLVHMIHRCKQHAPLLHAGPCQLTLCP